VPLLPLPLPLVGCDVGAGVVADEGADDSVEVAADVGSDEEAVELEAPDPPEPEPPNGMGGELTEVESLARAPYASSVMAPDGLTTPNMPDLQCVRVGWEQ